MSKRKRELPSLEPDDGEDVDDLVEHVLGYSRQQDHSAQDYSTESLRRGLALRARPTDIFVATAPKTGTTLLQQALHQLRAPPGGDMNFYDLYQVSPWVRGLFVFVFTRTPFP